MNYVFEVYPVYVINNISIFNNLQFLILFFCDKNKRSF